MDSSGLLPLALWGDKEKQSIFEGLFGPWLAMRRVSCLFFCPNFQLFLEGAPVGYFSAHFALCSFWSIHHADKTLPS